MDGRARLLIFHWCFERTRSQCRRVIEKIRRRDAQNPPSGPALIQTNRGSKRFRIIPIAFLPGSSLLGDGLVAFDTGLVPAIGCVDSAPDAHGSRCAWRGDVQRPVGDHEVGHRRTSVHLSRMLVGAAAMNMSNCDGVFVLRDRETICLRSAPALDRNRRLVTLDGKSGFSQALAARSIQGVFPGLYKAADDQWLTSQFASAVDWI